jgi:hypothetical protein
MHSDKPSISLVPVAIDVKRLKKAFIPELIRRKYSLSLHRCLKGRSRA